MSPLSQMSATSPLSCPCADSSSDWRPRVFMTLACLTLQAAVAIVVPGVGDIIAIVGGTIATSIMLVIPAYCMGEVLEMTPARRAARLAMYAFSIVGYATVPAKVVQLFS